MATKMKADRQLIRMAERAGVELHKTDRRRKGESMLEWRMRCWGIPDFTQQPIDDQVLVWRLPPLELSPGGIVIPQTEQSPNVKGVLLAMGPRAMDILKSNGIDEGHIITFARFAGWEPHDNTPEFARHNQILIIKAKDVNCSDDLREAVRAGKLTYVQGSDGRYQLARVRRKALPENGKRRKLLALADGTSNEHEAATARKLARKVG